MTQRDDTVYLHEILDCIAQIEEYIQGVSYETFCAERMRQDAVVKQLENIGKAARKLSRNFRKKHLETILKRRWLSVCFPHSSPCPLFSPLCGEKRGKWE